MQHNPLINGKLVADGDRKAPVCGPAIGNVILGVAEAITAQADAAVGVTDQMFDVWNQTTPRTRLGRLLKLAGTIAAQAETLTQLESLNCSKPLHYMANNKMPAIANAFHPLVNTTRCLPGMAVGECLRGHASVIRCDPADVVVSIALWNYPLMVVAWELAPVLAAGDCVVMKPSETTPLTVLKLVELAKDIFSERVIDVLFGHGEAVGDPLTSYAKVRMVSLAGSATIGVRIIGHTASPIKRTYTELSGKIPAIVFDDVGINAMADGVRTFGFYNTGQDHTAACWIYTQQGIYDQLMEELGAAVASLKVGAPEDISTELGPLSSFAHLKRASTAVEVAKALPHIRVVAGGRRTDGADYYFQPTLLTGTRQEDAIVQREVFGPAVNVTPFSDGVQILSWTNNSQHGPASSVWMKDASCVHRLSVRLQYGCTWVNTHFMLVSGTSHGDQKLSGYGKDVSAYGFEDYTVVRHVVVKYG